MWHAPAVDDDPSTEHPGTDDGRVSATAVAAVLLAVIALALVGTRLVALDDEPSLAVVGDSITVVSSGVLAEQLGPDHDVDMAAALGVTVEQMQDEATTLATREPVQAVIELGSNDVLQDVPLATSTAQLEQMVSTFRDAGTRCVHVVNVSTVMQRNDGRWTGESAERFNAMSAALAASDDAVVIVDWNGAVVAAEERGESLVTDTVHPNGAGAQALATLVAESLDRGCPGAS